MSENYPKNPREEAFERLLEATLESETSGTPDLRDAVIYAPKKEEFAQSESPLRKLRFANIASAAGLVIALAALALVLFGDWKTPSMNEGPNADDQLEAEEPDASEEDTIEDRTPDFDLVSFSEADEMRDLPVEEIKTPAELKALIESDKTPTRVSLTSSSVTAQMLKDLAKAYPKLDYLSINGTPLENEDLDALLGFTDLRGLALHGKNIKDPFVMQAWLLDLFPGEISGRVHEKLIERKRWCQRLIYFATSAKLPSEHDAKDDPFVRLGASFFDNYFKNVQSLGLSYQTLQRFLRDKPSENVGALVDLTPNVKHLSISAYGMLDEDMEGLATSIRRRSFLAGDDSGLSARFKLKSFRINLWASSKAKERLGARGLVFLRDGKIFVPEMVEALGVENYKGNSRGSGIQMVLSSRLKALRSLSFKKCRGFASAGFNAWLKARSEMPKPLSLEMIDFTGTSFPNLVAESLEKHASFNQGLRHLKIEGSYLSDPLARALFDAYPKAEGKLPSGASREKNFIRLTAFYFDTRNPTSLRGVDQRHIVLRRTSDGKVIPLRYRASLSNEQEIRDYMRDAFGSVSFTQTYGVYALDSDPLPKGEYEAIAYSSGRSLRPVTINHDGVTTSRALATLGEPTKKYVFWKEAASSTFLVRVSAKDFALDYPLNGLCVLKKGSFMLRAPQPFDLDKGMNSDIRIGTGTIYFNEGNDGALSILVMAPGLPTLTIPLEEKEVEGKQLKKHVHWDGKAWQVTDIQD